MTRLPVVPVRECTMFNDPDHCYQALASHDERFDGRFFVGVRTTGIYCRPVCRVRLPRRENCTFHPSAAAAEAQGFRPCLRCRPELAPGWSTTDIEERLAHAGGRLIQAGTARISEVALRLGVSERHLRRIFFKAYGVTPGAWRQTQRLLLAKQLLTETSMSVLDVALAAGFGSARRLNATLQASYGLTPTDLRKWHRSGETQRMVTTGNLPFCVISATDSPGNIKNCVATTTDTAGSIMLKLSVRTPHATAALFTELARHAIPGLEHADATTHVRVLAVRSGTVRTIGTMQARVGATADYLVLSLSASLLPVVAEVLAIARDLYDVNTDPASHEAVLGLLSSGERGLRVAGVADGFEGVVRLLVESVLPLDEAIAALTALVREVGKPVEAPNAVAVGASSVPGLHYSFPGASELCALDTKALSACGLSAPLAESVLAFAELYLGHHIDLSASACVDEALALLATVPGMQQTVLDRIAMHVMRWPDAFPASEPELQARLGVDTREQALAHAERWRPWRAYTAVHLLHGGPPSQPGSPQPYDSSSGKPGSSRLVDAEPMAVHSRTPSLPTGAAR